MNRAPLTPPYTFVLKLTDRSGGMEMIAATFAHRGISLSTSLGNDGALDPDGRATVLVTFAATPAKKEALRRALSRLSRVVSLVEYPADSPLLRKTALIRLRRSIPEIPDGVTVERVGAGAENATGGGGEATLLLVGSPRAVDAVLEAAAERGDLGGVTHAVFAL
jgi:hypothetical protein